MRSVYIHIPFCKSICSYCDFCKFLHEEVYASEYLNELSKEIDKYYDNDKIRTLYIGGGTPSVLSLNNLKKLFEITKKFDTSLLEEFTFEMNIDDITEEKLLLLKTNNVNRISIGIQSFNEINLKYLNRKHTKNEIIKNINLAKNYFTNINVDLMFALPIETFSISTYSLIIEQNTVLSYNKVKPIEEDLDYKMYSYILKELKKNNYNHYEVSNFAKEGYQSKHNLNYWQNNEYYGFGLGAHGFISELRYENTRSFNTYLKGNYRFNELVLSKREDMENEVILGLRKLEGINIVDFFNKYKINIQEEFNITPLLKNGLLKIKDNNIYIPEEKIYIMNTILNEILK